MLSAPCIPSSFKITTYWLGGNSMSRLSYLQLMYTFSRNHLKLELHAAECWSIHNAHSLPKCSQLDTGCIATARVLWWSGQESQQLKGLCRFQRMWWKLIFKYQHGVRCKGERWGMCRVANLHRKPASQTCIANLHCKPRFKSRANFVELQGR